MMHCLMGMGLKLGTAAHHLNWPTELDYTIHCLMGLNLHWDGLMGTFGLFHYYLNVECKMMHCLMGMGLKLGITVHHLNWLSELDYPMH